LGWLRFQEFKNGVARPGVGGSDSNAGSRPIATPALAHTGVGDATGFAHGFLHPIGGLDHVLVMVAVGVLAAHLSGHALWLVPGAFVLVMAVGGALAMVGVELPFVEIGVALSVVALGAAIALRLDLPLAAAMALVGLFAVFHGQAHGAEMPETASGLAYGAGFILATTLLHVVGIGLGIALARLGPLMGRRVAQVGGGLMALAGVAILAGLL
jgi:urease accessory protein